MTFIISVGRNWTNLIEDIRKQLVGEFKPFCPIRINLLYGYQLPWKSGEFLETFADAIKKCFSTPQPSDCTKLYWAFYQYCPFKPIKINLLHGKPGYTYNEAFEREIRLGYREWDWGGSNYK